MGGTWQPEAALYECQPGAATSSTSTAIATPVRGAETTAASAMRWEPAGCAESLEPHRIRAFFGLAREIDYSRGPEPQLKRLLAMVLGIGLVSILMTAAPTKAFSCTQARRCTLFVGEAKELAEMCVQLGGKLGQSCPSEKVLSTCTAKMATWSEVIRGYSSGDEESDSDALGIYKVQCASLKGTFKVTPAFAKLDVPPPAEGTRACHLGTRCFELTARVEKLTAVNEICTKAEGKLLAKCPQDDIIADCSSSLGEAGVRDTHHYSSGKPETDKQIQKEAQDHCKGAHQLFKAFRG